MTNLRQTVEKAELATQKARSCVELMEAFDKRLDRVEAKLDHIMTYLEKVVGGESSTHE